MEYQFKIQIKGITKPPVWRKVIVPANFTFLQFHSVIQTVFGWDDYHLFEFEDKEYQGSIRIAIPSEDDFDFGVKTLDASKVKLSKVFTDNIRKLLYVYDFGDNWVHEITLEAVSDNKRKEAICLSGKGSCPPEDCGGCYGYEEMKMFSEQCLTVKKLENIGTGWDWKKMKSGVPTPLISMKLTLN